MFKLLNRISTIPALLVTVVVFAAFIGFLLPHQKESTQAYSRDVGSVGLSFFLTPERIYEMAEAYGEAGRREHIKVWLTYDMAWPVVYSLLFLICINRLLGYAHGDRGARLCAAALLPVGLDIIENGLAVMIMAAYPDRMIPAAWVLSVTTSLKWIFMGVVCALLGYGLLAWPICFVRRKLAH